MRTCNVAAPVTARNSPRQNRLFAAILGTLVLLSGCSGRTSALEPGGPQSAHLETLWWWMLWVCTAVFVVVMALLAFALARRRNRERDEAGSGARTALTWIAGGVIVTGVVLFALLIASVLTDRRLDAIEKADALTLTVTGYQWWWEVRYENSLPSNVVVTANELHVPVGKPVRLNLRASDVIHSFWVPRLHGKRDLIPGRDTELWIQVDQPGEYRGVCAEFCGHQHAHMQFLVVAEPETEFHAWLEAQRAPAREPETEQQKRGRDVFLSTTCVMCHSVRGTPAGSRAGPDLTHLASRRTIAAGARPNNRGHLAGWVLDPQGIKPGARMPAHQFAGADLHALLDYLESLK